MNDTLFRSRKLLERLSALAVGASLATLTAAFFVEVFRASRDPVALSTGLPTLVLGTAWALLLRWPKMVLNGRVRAGWLLSIPLAATNAGIAAGLLFGVWEPGHSLRNALMGFLLGASVGAMFWIPALLMTLLCFGVPIAWGQRLAAKGLAGQERGDATVGAASAVLAGVGVAGHMLWHSHRGVDPTVFALGATGWLAGVAVTVLALLRTRARRAFVARVEAGQEPRFRVEPTDEGKVLVRIVTQGEGYRVADYAEEIARLDAGGEVTRAAKREG